MSAKFVNATAAALIGGTMLIAGTASAATVSFEGGSGPEVASLSGTAGPGGVGYTVTTDIGGLRNDYGLVTQNAEGLGINGVPDKETGFIDGSQFSYEALVVTFDSAVRLLSFTLGAFDDNDDYDLFVNGVLVGSALTLGTNTIDMNYVTSFAIKAIGDLASDTSEDVPSELLFGNDEYTLASFTIAPVPLPAAGGLLVAALGGLGLLRRSGRRC